MTKNLLMTLAVASLCMLEGAARADERLDALIAHVDDLWRGSSSRARIRMTVRTKHYHRTLRMMAWSLGKEKSLVRILSPLKEKGTATLKSGRHLYTYLPRTDRTIRLTSGMMMGSWMGSHFTNDDLVKESRLLEDYVATRGAERKVGAHTHLDITLEPKPDAPVVWGRIVLTVELERKIPVRQVYYDEDLEVARTMFFERVTRLAGRDAPAILRVVPADEPEEFTEILYEALELDVRVSEATFSVARLRKR